MQQSKVAAVGLFVLGLVVSILGATIGQRITGSAVTGLIAGDLLMIAVMWGWVRNDGGLRALGVVAVEPRTLAAAALLGGSFWLFNALLQAALPFHFDSASVERVLEDPPVVLVVIGAAIVGPIAEELMFRGNLLPAFIRRRRWVGLIVVSLMFSMAHLNPAQAIPAFLTGLGLGLLAIRTRSIVPSIVAHVANNLVIVAIERFAPSSVEDHPLAFIAGAAAMFAVGLYLLSASSSAPATPASPSR